VGLSVHASEKKKGESSSQVDNFTHMGGRDPLADLDALRLSLISLSSAPILSQNISRDFVW
jgi:hypothetical protein